MQMYEGKMVSWPRRVVHHQDRSGAMLMELPYSNVFRTLLDQCVAGLGKHQ